jgi:putative phosphoesterase
VNGNIAWRIVSEPAKTSTIYLPECRRIGVLSDTHIPHRLPDMPPSVYQALAGCDIILHAGDLESADILAPLVRIAPTYAVRGNLHWQFSTGTHDQDLPLSLTLCIAGHTVWMTHGHISFAYSLVDKVLGISERRSLDQVNRQLIARLARMRPPQADVVVFGHSHRSCAVRLDGVLYFNPGAVSAAAETRSKEPPRIGLLTLDGGDVTYTWQDI